jgi:hypothetical protein
LACWGRNEKVANDRVAEIVASGGHAVALIADVTQEDQSISALWVIGKEAFSLDKNKIEQLKKLRWLFSHRYQQCYTGNNRSN